MTLPFQSVANPLSDGSQPGTDLAPPPASPAQAAPIRRRKRKNALPGKSKEYRQLWRLVDGAVFDALYSHDDYLTDKGRRNARNSINKRVVGNIMGFVEQAKGRQAEPIATVRSDAADRASPAATGCARTVKVSAVTKWRGVVGNAASRLFGLFKAQSPQPVAPELSDDPCLSAQRAMGIC